MPRQTPTRPQGLFLSLSLSLYLSHNPPPSFSPHSPQISIKVEWLCQSSWHLNDASGKNIFHPCNYSAFNIHSLALPGMSSFEGALLVHIVPQPPTCTCMVSPPSVCDQLWPFRGCNLWPWVQRFEALTTRLHDQWRLSQLYLPAIDTTVSLKYAHTHTASGSVYYTGFGHTGSIGRHMETAACGRVFVLQPCR